MEKNGFEIERKFLIRYPDLDWLNSAAERTEIEQTYLIAERPEISERVRKRGLEGNFSYTHTRKEHITTIRRVEIEREIGEEEYGRLLLRADPSRRTIQKTRYCLFENGTMYEIDVFPFWKDRAFLEVELSDEAQPIVWPERLRLIREVTDDRRYSNYALSKMIPQEEI